MVALSTYIVIIATEDLNTFINLTPVFGIVIGGPVWLISFPIFYRIFKGYNLDFCSSFGLAVFFSGMLTLGIPYLLSGVGTV